MYHLANSGCTPKDSKQTFYHMERVIFKVMPCILGYSHSPYVWAYGGYHARVILSKKDAHLNTMERFYIHKEASFDNQLNDKHDDDIFDYCSWFDTW